MKILITFLTLLSLNSYAGTWSIKNRYTGKNSNVKSITYGDSVFSTLTQNAACIDGDLVSAYAELSFQNSYNTALTKKDFFQNYFEVEAVGPLCTAYENVKEGDCLKLEIVARAYQIQACDPNAKYFPVINSPEVSFEQLVTAQRTSTVFLTNEEISSTNTYFSGSLQVRLYGQGGSLDISLNSYQYGLNNYLERAQKKFSIPLNPNVNLLAQKYPYKISESCSLDQESENVFSLSCKVNGESYSKILLPRWALGEWNETTKFETIHTSQQAFPIYKLKETRSNRNLVLNKDYTSVAELWELIMQEQVPLCVEEDSRTASVLAQDLIACNYGCASSPLKIKEGNIFVKTKLEKEGIRFYKRGAICTKEDGSDQKGYSCLETKKVSSNILIPYCK